MDDPKPEPIDPSRNVSRVFAGMLSAGKLLWAIAVAVVLSIVWAMAILSSVQSSITLLQSEKVNADQVRAILDREGNGVRSAIKSINESSVSLNHRLRNIEIELARLTALVEARLKPGHGATPAKAGPSDNAAVGKIPSQSR